MFDPNGRLAKAVLRKDEDHWIAELVEAPRSAGVSPLSTLTICSAVPKGNRADWMVEKLAELGVGRLVPIVTGRSVVDPGGNKLDRWRRIASEAAKQSRAATTMVVGEVTALADALARHGQGAVVLSTEGPGGPLGALSADVLFVGPEGGWNDAELGAFRTAGTPFVTLGPSILRVETAAVCGAAVIASRRIGGVESVKIER